MFRRILLVTAILTAILLTLLFGANRFSMTVIPNGEPAVTLEYGEQYQEAGARICLRGTWFLKDGIEPENAVLEMESTVEENRLGRYYVRYRANFLWLHAEAERQVSVIDSESPVITLIGDEQVEQDDGRIYTESGFYAFDRCDGDITDRVVRQEYPGKITYAVTDFSGNPAYAERIVPFHDPVPPEILLEGGEFYAIPTGKPYREPGFRAADNVDGDLTEFVTVEGEVDWLRPGIYPISYRVTDAYQNTTEVIRRVQVTATERPETDWPRNKTIYLTFDDGPGPHTEKLLDVLDIFGVKATFFVVDSEYNHLMQEIVNRGHSIGIHSVTHDYGAVYASPEAYFADLYAMQKIIYENTGVLTTLMRFPGGSSNEVSRGSCEGIMTFLTEAVQDAGFRFFDWNVDSDDAGNARKRKTVYENVIRGIEETGIALVLQHDIHPYSVDAVAEILQWGQENGYTFLPLEPDSPNFPHPLNN